MDDKNTELATLAGGCFWCLEAVYEQIRGVKLVVSGYTGGHTHDPSYEQVCGGRTGHAEVVQITFDPQIISYREILEVFFAIHDPTTLNAQGPDIGTQYRSAIFAHSPQQKNTAEHVMVELEAARIWDHLIVTDIADATTFFPAEEYHQQYYRRNANQPYCQILIAPKMAKFRKDHLEKIKPEATSAPM
ncbi:peptide-methionine (S)-S-oxide reductase MsrA [SAR202 cluster bacterium AC-647-N09_OGT_505m]|nr:peptide-methionine (S)-S-oxide reductase MsrA [SAR202 cluster bacterium AC-647-N09_OGT_505m]